MPRVEKSVFISYRRTNVPWALNVYQDLTHHGHDVFFDFEGIGSGDFESIIVDNITSRSHFLILLTPSALERCGDPGDWLRREIEVALETKRNIVPLMLEGFSFGTPSIATQLTGKLAALKSYNGLSMPAEYFLAAMEKLRTKFLNVAVSAPLQPAGAVAKDAAQEQKVLADAAPPVQEQELTAQQYFERGFASSDPDEKVRFYTQAIRLNPNYSYAYNNRGVACKAKGDLNAAILDFDEAIRLKLDFAEAYYNRGILRDDKGELDAAILDYNEALRLKPDYAEAYNNRANSRHDKGDLDAAILDYNEALRLKPDYAEAYNNRANSRHDKGDLDAAIIDYNEALRLKPNFADAYYSRAISRQAKGDLDAAIMDYNEALRLKPNFADAYHNRALLLRLMNQPAAAIADFDRYLRLGGGERDGDTLKVQQWIRDLNASEPPNTPPAPP